MATKSPATPAALPSRRAVAKGAAWTLPVISLAAAAPTASASTPSCNDCVIAKKGFWVRFFQAYSLATGLQNLCGGTATAILVGGINGATGYAGSTSYKPKSLELGVDVNLFDGTIDIGATSTTMVFPVGTPQITKVCVDYSLQLKLTVGGTADCVRQLCWTLDHEGFLLVANPA